MKKKLILSLCLMKKIRIKIKEHTTKTHFINYDKFDRLSQLIHDKSPYKTCTFRIVYKRMNDLKILNGCVA